MSHEQIKVCKKHEVVSSESCTVCKLSAERDELLRTFLILAMACEVSDPKQEEEDVLKGIAELGRSFKERFGEPMGGAVAILKKPPEQQPRS
jgi:hypothetical protein